MITSPVFRAPFVSLVASLLVFFLVLMPLSVSAATEHVVTGTIDVSSLTSASVKPTLFGTASGTKKMQVILYKEGVTKKFYRSAIVKVRDGTWKAKISKKLSDGRYDVEIVSKDAGRKVIGTGTLIIDKEGKRSDSAATTLAVAPMPLLFGGVARAGASVAISYLQITNIGKEPASLRGFWLRQNGSAPAESTIGLSTVDDKGGSRGLAGGVEGSTPFKNGLAFVPTDAVFAPGQMRLFTIKAMMTSNVSSYFGKQLMIDVTSVDTNAAVKGTFPMRGTTWTIAN